MKTESIAQYLAAHLVIDTHDAGLMEDALKSRWQARSFAARDSDKKFHALARHRELDRLGISFGYYGCGVQSDFNGVALVRQHFIVSGVGTTNIRRKNFTLDQSNSCVILPNTEYTWKFSDACQHITFRIPQTNLELMLTNLTGVSPRNRLQFGLTSASGHRFEQLRRFALLITDEVVRPETPHIVIKELEDVFLTQFLAANDHNHRDALLARATTTTPKHVHMVEEYIVAHWDKAFTIENVSKITGISARAIYATFRQYRGYGPKAFLRQTRLNKARELLLTTGMDVGSVAKRCGFSNAGHFARYYRSAFGELPSRTMR